MKNQKYHTVGTVPKSNRKIGERATGTSIKKTSGGLNYIYGPTP
jgi:hypothetical protein